MLWEASVIEQYRAQPQTIRARISIPVSAGQCHLNILRRFSWHSLAYVHTGGLKPHAFHFIWIVDIVCDAGPTLNWYHSKADN